MASMKMKQAFAIASLVACAGLASADTVIRQFQLYDHPDSVETPPPYGLRLDGVFNGLSGAGTNAVTTFSMNQYSNTVLTVTDNGSTIAINITGTLYGGVDSGTGYGFGAGDYAVSYNYVFGVTPMGTGWVTMPPSPLNGGTLTALGNNNGVASGSVFTIYDDNSMAKSFEFLQDDHRLTIATGGSENYLEAGQGFWVGRGWLSYNANNNNSAGTQDWLFIGKLVPLPTTAGLGIAGLTALGVVRRRRA